VKLSFFYRSSKFNALMTLGILSLTAISLPVTAASQAACIKTSTSNIACAKLVSKAVARSNRERVRFAKGKTSTTLTREIPADGWIDLIINAKKGQAMGFTVGYDFKNSDIQAYLTEPGLQDISLSSGPKKTNEFVIKKTGDHYITVKNTTQKKITMTLYLNIN
jgi:hypothetical protein